MNWKSGSLGRKVLGAITIVVLAIVGFQVVYFPEQQIDQLTRALETKAFSLSRLVAHTAAPSLEFDDKETAVEVLRGAQRDDEFVGGAILSEDGKEVLASLNVEKMKMPSGLAWSEQPQSSYVEGLFQVVAPVKSKGGAKGILVMSFSREKITAEIQRVRKTTVVISTAMLLVGVAIALGLGRSLTRRMQVLVEAAEAVAQGDLTRTAAGAEAEDDVGRLAAAFNRMVVSQRQLVKQITETAVQLSTSASEFSANAQQQERGASEQSAAVNETRRTMENLLESAREIAKTATSVLGNAERSQSNSQVVAERIAALSAHTQRIAEILEIIKDIANKSDLLALNAALEGTKAGEAGKGFSLVASQMQRLAENVMGAVKDIKELTTTITSATQATVLATEESTKLSADTTRSSRQIALIIQQQQSSTEQVTSAMELVSDIAVQTATGSKEIVASASELRHLTERLQALVGQFKLDGAAQLPAGTDLVARG